MMWPWSCLICVWALTLRVAECTRHNYALGKPAKQSSTYWIFNGNVSHAVDGSISTESHTGREDFPFLVVDLQQAIWITGVALTNRDNRYYLRLSNFTIMVGVHADRRTNQHCHTQLPPVPRGDTAEYQCDQLMQGRVISVNKTSSTDATMQYLVIRELLVFGFGPGKIYQLYGGSHCDPYTSQSQESTFLQDGDLTTCKLVHSGAREMFGIFFNEPRRRSIAVQVYGKVIHCNPVYGISLAVVSTDREIHLCKPYHTTSEYICNNICLCPEGKGCSHVIIMVSPMMALTDRAPQICEINLEG